MLAREEYIEQAYFFRTLRERLKDNLPAQEVLERLHEEALATTRLPLAIQFLTSELKLHGVLAGAMTRLGHYFTAWQSFVMRKAEEEGARFDLGIALLILEREAEYKAGQPTRPGLFVYQFETISRNRLGYDEGLGSMSQDSFYDEEWQRWILRLRGRVGTVELGDLIYLRSQYFLQQRRRQDAKAGKGSGVEGQGSRGEVGALEMSPSADARSLASEGGLKFLFGEKEGRIAYATRDKDPLYLFAALQRQLGYPAVPRQRSVEKRDLTPVLAHRIQLLEQRVKLLEAELKGTLDLSQFYVKTDDAAPPG